jgi:hypothetical protein
MAVFFDVVDQPRKAFTHVVEHPKSLWTPVILIMMSLIVLAVVTPGAFPSGGQQSGTTGGNATGSSGFRQRTGQPATANQTPQPGQTGQTVPTTGIPFTQSVNSILTPIIGIALLVISWLVIGVLGHFLGKLFGGTSRFITTAAIGVWTTLPFFFRDLTQIAFQLITKQTIVYQGLAFLSPLGRNASAALRTLSTALSSIDPFAIWFLVLLGIGISVATKVKAWKAILIAIFIFVVLIGVRILPTLLGISVRIPILG